MNIKYRLDIKVMRAEKKKWKKIYIIRSYSLLNTNAQYNIKATRLNYDLGCLFKI